MHRCDVGRLSVLSTWYRRCTLTNGQLHRLLQQIFGRKEGIVVAGMNRVRWGNCDDVCNMNTCACVAAVCAVDQVIQLSAQLRSSWTTNSRQQVLLTRRMCGRGREGGTAAAAGGGAESSLGYELHDAPAGMTAAGTVTSVYPPGAAPCTWTIQGASAYQPVRRRAQSLCCFLLLAER